MALYLTYRPQSFADVVGQDHIVTTLERAIEQGSVSHAYLFCGTRGTGKTSVARILAKTILLGGMTDENLKAHFTKAIEEGSFVDLIEIDGASNRKIDDVRDLIEKINFTPSMAKAKVYIIDEVHMLTKEAFNALLKTLEEPPPYAYFILATTELHKVPETIQSRCQRFLFRKVKDDDIIRRLQYIADHERIVVDREALRAIARHAQGSFRDGIALLDQLRSLEKITLADVTDRIGRTSAVFVDDLLSAVTECKGDRIIDIVHELEEANVPIDAVTGDLLGIARESLHDTTRKGKSTAVILGTIDVLLQALRDMRSSPLPGLVLESALLSLCNDGATVTHGTLPASTIKESRSPAAPRTANPSPDLEEKKKESTLSSATVEAEELTLEALARHWETILKMVTPSSVRMSLKDATVSTVQGDTVTLTFGSSFHQGKVSDVKASRAVEEALLSIFKRPVHIRCITEQDAAPVTTGPDTDLAAAAAEVFGGF